MKPNTFDCIVSGGGPAGMMCGFLLARAGREVLVLEKHKDFLRDFRGDTIHPSTLDVMWELGLLEKFLKLPHEEVRETHAEFGNKRYKVLDFTGLPTHCKFVAMMPQWDFLNFLAEEAKRYPNFHLEMQAESLSTVVSEGRVCGLRYRTGEHIQEARAKTVIAADGRNSRLRSAENLELEDLGAPIDCMWFKLPWLPGDPTGPQGNSGGGEQLAMLYRGDYWQCALLIAKGRDAEIRREGITAFHERLRKVAGFAAGRVDTIASFDDVSLLVVHVNRLKKWAIPGFLCIGDAAHAMSPVFGCGINLALQDAVATANILGPLLKAGKTPSLANLLQVQRRREYPTKVYQNAQVKTHKRMFSRRAPHRTKAPLMIRVLDKSRWLRRSRAVFGAIGPRPEHVVPSRAG